MDRDVGSGIAILMRPGAPNERLARVLDSHANVWCWPAFSIRLPDDSETVRRRLGNLQDIDTVLFVSPSSVAAAAHWVRQWPEYVRLAAAGEGTARAIRAVWGESLSVIHPGHDTTDSGSEGLLACFIEQGLPVRLLVLRAQTGRNWLGEQLSRRGCDVEYLTVYLREAFTPTREDVARMRDAIRNELPPPVVYITSSDAVDIYLQALSAVECAQQWGRRAKVLTVHPRIAERLRQQGFEHIEVLPAQDDLVAGRIRDLL